MFSLKVVGESMNSVGYGIGMAKVTCSFHYTKQLCFSVLGEYIYDIWKIEKSSYHQIMNNLIQEDIRY